jgi:hypothetical protein
LHSQPGVKKEDNMKNKEKTRTKQELKARLAAKS